MKFKTKEELIKERLEIGEDDDIQCGVEIGMNITFTSFVERIEFYKCYRNDILGCYGNHNDIWEEFKKENKHLKTPGMVNIDYWNNWLFDYCFGDVIEDDDEAMIPNVFDD